MKHTTVALFVPHKGCPHQCVFCNQKSISGETKSISADDVHAAVADAEKNHEISGAEIAFFGGSFTGIPIDEQSAFLEVAADYKSRGLIDKIHMSTRPDYIDRKVLDNLRSYDADVIELGVQSLDDRVLTASGRGHNAKAVYTACDLIKEYGFELAYSL